MPSEGCSSTLLLKMWLLSLLLWLLVSPRATYGSNCLVETLKCSRFRPPLHTYKELFVSRTQMNEMCRQQDRFFECLDHVVASRVTYEDCLPSTLQHARTLIEDLCLSTSSWQKKYFELAPCINRQYTEFCTSPEFLGTVGLGDKPRSQCSFHEEAVNCIAATLSMKCGMDAGKLFHHLLRMTSDGGKNCYAVGSEALFFTPVQEDSCSEETDACNEVFSSRMKRIGSTPEQDQPAEDSLPVTLQVFAEDSDLISEVENTTNGNLDEFSSSPISKRTSMPFEAPYTTARLGHLGIISPEKLDKSKKLKDIRIESALRFQGNNSISQYVRFPGFNSEEFSFCKNDFEEGKKIYICIYVLREKSPICLEGGKNHSQTSVAINPEDIDPELGAKLYAMFPYTYHFRPYEEIHERMFKHIHEYNKNMFKHIHEFRRASLQTTTDESVRTTGSATPNLHDLYRSLYNKYTINSPVAHGPDSPNPVSEGLDDKVQEGARDDRNLEYDRHSSSISKKPAAGGLLQNYMTVGTTSRLRRKAEAMDDFSEPSTSSTIASQKTAFDTKHLSGEQKKMFTLLAEETEWLIENAYKSPAKVDWLTPTAVRIAISGRENSQLVNVTCGRVNECHPNATDIERCLYYFILDDKVLTEETESQVRHLSSRKASSDRQMNTDIDDILSLVEEGSGLLENIKPMIIFDESNEQSLDLPITETESEHLCFSQHNLEESVEISEEDREMEPVQFNLFETYSFDSMPFVDSEQSLQVRADDTSMDSSEEDENPTSSTFVEVAFGENSREINLLESLKNLENLIADVLDNIHID